MSVCDRGFGGRKQNPLSCFNPCFNGCRSAIVIPAAAKAASSMVSILVLMDVGLRYTMIYYIYP